MKINNLQSNNLQLVPGFESETIIYNYWNDLDIIAGMIFSREK